MSACDEDPGQPFMDASKASKASWDARTSVILTIWLHSSQLAQVLQANIVPAHRNWAALVSSGRVPEAPKPSKSRALCVSHRGGGTIVCMSIMPVGWWAGVTAESPLLFLRLSTRLSWVGGAFLGTDGGWTRSLPGLPM